MKGFFKKSGIFFDTKVKKGSNNAVTSDAVAKAIEEGGGGGGGTTDYTELTNKPKINNVELSGNKTLADFSIASSTDLDTLEDVVETKADKSVVVALDERVGLNTGSINTAKENIGNLSSLNTMDKTSLVNAINEVAGGGGSGGGLKCQLFQNKVTTVSTTVSGIGYVGFSNSDVKSWFDTTPTTIRGLIANKYNGTVTRVAIRNQPLQFITEQSNSAVSYEYVLVFYE